MSNFKYIKKSGQTFMVLGDRNEIRWKDRFVPEADTIEVFATAISLNKSTIALAVSGSEKLTATLTPSGAQASQVVWSSSDEEVATVAADGTVTGVKAGTAKVTAKSKWDPSVKAECTATIS